ncbi:Acidic leucine-rich nuclear phosphoprotein 32 member [Dermatophagoides farinae]|uniref:Acidic leucine-rich nuclear phosphoprotein 32 member n=1 Tax=Dermatophagoides farinae TaxID=6954 RepID=A0A922I8Z4_DERFA|nr:acidic leucine-rich nuclear phosphoprotein 32 family member A-like [Dermatophagoides farinae]KAH9526393.1 Acidic leucine-rich nuclear phosphoprotein 32 member [Dermatophagoides farinae]
MEKRIELEKRGRNHDQIKELNLDNCRSTNIVGLDDSFVNLECLSMINIGLTSLKGFPNLPNLKRLELSDNRISNGLNHLKGSVNLQYLNLCGNKFKDIETLEPLKELKKLEILDLFNCEVTEQPEYRKKVFDMLPELKFLDGYDRNDQEIEDDEEDDGGEENDDDIEDEDDDDDDDDEGIDENDNDDDDDDEEVDEDEDEEEDNEIGLSYLARDKIDEEDENNEFNPEDSEVDSEDSEDIDEEDEENDSFEEQRNSVASVNAVSGGKTKAPEKGLKRKEPEHDDDEEEEA